jgi:hypothetical protein
MLQKPFLANDLNGAIEAVLGLQSRTVRRDEPQNPATSF